MSLEQPHEDAPQADTPEELPMICGPHNVRACIERLFRNGTTTVSLDGQHYSKEALLAASGAVSGIHAAIFYSRIQGLLSNPSRIPMRGWGGG